MKQTMYIAGPMRGKPDYNRAAFRAAAKFVEDEFGVHPVNPVDIEASFPCVGDDGEVDDRSLEGLLRIECEFVRHVDAIYLLEGWEYSEGARRELHEYLDSHRPERQLVIVQKGGLV